MSKIIRPGEEGFEEHLQSFLLNVENPTEEQIAAGEKFAPLLAKMRDPNSGCYITVEDEVESDDTSDA